MQYLKTIRDKHAQMTSTKTIEVLSPLQVGQWYTCGNERRIYLGHIAGIPQYEAAGPRLQDRMSSTRSWVLAWEDKF